jgi:uncharacterized protein (TIGR00255 family)
MIRSMTGFGAGRAKEGDEEISVEIRSVNHKYCEVKVRLPREFNPLEADLSRTVKDKLHRGGIDVYVKRLSGPERTILQPKVDLALAREYLTVFGNLRKELKLEGQVPFTTLLEAQGVLTVEDRPTDIEQAKKALFAAAQKALEELVHMREREGKILAEDLLARASLMRDHAALIGEAAPKMVVAYRDKLHLRVKELAGGLVLDPARVAQEVALFAERCDIAEELTRLASHLDQFEKLVLGDEPAGRRMEFLVQEMGREVNTTGSKSQSAEIAATVVSLKAELERIREQVANVE